MRVINYVLPHQLMSLSLVGLWLLMQQSLSVGNIVLGTAIAIGAGYAGRALDLERPRWRKPWLLPLLVMRVLIDVFQSNLAVARIILAGERSRTHSGFLRIPLKLTNPAPLVFLSMIITATPGTVWVEYDAQKDILLIHVLDLYDDQAWIDTIKNRYESLLYEMFQ